MTNLVVGLGQQGNMAIMGIGLLLLVGLLVIGSQLLKLRKELAAKSPPAADSGAEVTASGRPPTKGFTKPASDQPPAPAAAAPAAAPEAVAPPKPSTPDPGMVTQYQPGTGEGIGELEEQLKQDPENPDLLDWLAFMYYSNKKYQEAIDTYRRAIAINYDNEHQHYYLANSYYQLGQIERAIEEWEVVLELKPGSKLAHNAEERIEKSKKGQAVAIESGPKGAA